MTKDIPTPGLTNEQIDFIIDNAEDHGGLAGIEVLRMMRSRILSEETYRNAVIEEYKKVAPPPPGSAAGAAPQLAGPESDEIA